MLNWGDSDDLTEDSGDEVLWRKCCQYVSLNIQPLVAANRETAVKLVLEDPEWWEIYLIKWTEVILTCYEDKDKVDKILGKAGREYLEKISKVE